MLFELWMEPAQAGQYPDAKAAGVPERVEQARSTAELVEPLGAPSEMVALLDRRGCQELPRPLRAGHQGLAAVEGLGGDLAGVIDAHEGGALPALAARKLSLGHARGRRGAGGGIGGAEGSKALVESGYQAVGPRERRLHGSII